MLLIVEVWNRTDRVDLSPLAYKKSHIIILFTFQSVRLLENHPLDF